MSVNNYLKALVTDGASDIHFKVGRPPLRRINGLLSAAPGEGSLTPEDTENLAIQMIGDRNWGKFLENSEIDTSYSIAGFSRFRVNVFRQRGSVSIIMRIIPNKVPTLDELTVPQVVKRISLLTRGLILVTGTAGSGKSSTLAGMVDHINESRACHIITIEDPIEFLHSDRIASINQREIGVDTSEFSVAFRSALRQDPDIILVGELRDAETMKIALQAAETGHLVMATVHTTDAKETIARFVDSFAPFEQKQIRIQLAANLRAVISQRLLERADKQGLVLAAEIMVVNAAIRDYILDPEKTADIVDNMAKGGKQYGSRTFDQAIMELLVNGRITEDEAVRNATSANDFRLKLSLK